ncbi:hypothetical protein [Aeromicrobium sp. CF3.5]|uniref:hypothetical protein n=1 Tax=Aeromicrobium sp. CF3.5 TaxID=3373078 RepID=UPI003EE63F85
MRVKTVIGGVLLAVLVVTGVVVAVVDRSDDGFPAPATDGLPYTAPDVVNPMRGQFDNILTGLFPQSSDAQDSLADWPGTRDAAIRLTWRSLQPVDPSTLPDDATDEDRFDFTAIDRALQTYAERDQRLDLRISTYDSCCRQLSPGDVNIGVPDWFAQLPGVVDELDRDGVTQVIPDWNSDAYLDNVTELLAALGRRYDGDERLAIFEMSGYGDFGENVLSVSRDELGVPGPPEEDSEAQLGYYSQYEDQFITAESVERLVTANLEAFPRTQMVAAPGNPEIIKQLMRDNDAVDDLVHPVGVRSDCLGIDPVLPTWAIDEFSVYVERQDPIIGVLTQRLSEAPVLTEWCQIGDEDPRDYYERGLRDVIDQQVSMTSSSGFPDQFSEAPMDSELYELWRLANVYAGYRYVASAELIARDGGVAGPARWKNFGVSSVHEQWRIGYQLRDESGAVVAEAESGIDLRDIDTAQDSGRGSPTLSTATERVSFDTDLEPGTYTVSVIVEWDEHKLDAIRTVEYAPMALAQEGRTDGAYPIGMVTIPDS